MSTHAVLVIAITAAANAFSGALSIVQPRPVARVLHPAMHKLGIPLSWSVFPIGTLKLAGAIGLLLSLAGVPLVGTAAATGLVLFFVCAVFAHVRVADYSGQFFLATGLFLPLAVGTLTLTVG